MDPLIAQQCVNTTRKFILLRRQERLVLQERQGRVPFTNHWSFQIVCDCLAGINVQMLVKAANVSKAALQIEGVRRGSV
jgi:hypothetical protein